MVNKPHTVVPMLHHFVVAPRKQFFWDKDKQKDHVQRLRGVADYLSACEFDAQTGISHVYYLKECILANSSKDETPVNAALFAPEINFLNALNGSLTPRFRQERDFLRSTITTCSSMATLFSHKFAATNAAWTYEMSADDKLETLADFGTSHIQYQMNALNDPSIIIKNPVYGFFKKAAKHNKQTGERSVTRAKHSPARRLEKDESMLQDDTYLFEDITEVEVPPTVSFNLHPAAGFDKMSFINALRLAVHELEHNLQDGIRSAYDGNFLDEDHPLFEEGRFLSLQGKCRAYIPGEISGPYRTQMCENDAFKAQNMFAAPIFPREV